MILHILWLILKFIGITVLVILGILVLLICIVLFTPLRYQADISCKGTKESLKGEIEVSWLCRIISARINLDGSDVKILARAAWKKLYDSEAEKIDAADATDAKEKQQEAMQEEKKPPLVEAPQKADSPVKSANKQAPVSPVQQEICGQPDACEIHIKPDVTEKPDSAETDAEPKSQPKKKKRSGIFSFFKKIWNAITGIWEKIKYTLDRICANINVLSEKKDKILAFLNDEVHKGAFQKTIGELKRLLYVLCPKKIKGNVRFGFEDPYLTGKSLAVLSVLYPFWANTLTVTPEFDTQIFEGEIYLKGKVRVASFVRTSIVLLMDKCVRRTIKDIRKFKL